MSPQRIAISTGEPAGIGPDLTVQLAQREHPDELVALSEGETVIQLAQAASHHLAVIAATLKRTS